MEVKLFNPREEIYKKAFLEIGEGFVFEDWQMLEHFMLNTGRDLGNMKVRFLLSNQEGEGVCWSEYFQVCLNFAGDLSMFVGNDKKILHRDHPYNRARLLEVYEVKDEVLSCCGEYRFAGGGFEHVRMTAVDIVSKGVKGEVVSGCSPRPLGGSLGLEDLVASAIFHDSTPEYLLDQVVKSTERYMGKCGLRSGGPHGWTGFGGGKKSKKRKLEEGE